MILKLQKAGTINIQDNKGLDRNNYQQWLKLSPTQKLKRRVNIAKSQFNQSSSPIYNSLKAIFGGFDPENPDLITGEPNMLPSRGVNPKTVQNVTKGVRTLEDYLKTTKVSAPKLEGTSALRNNYNTDRFVAGTLFENSLPEEALKVQGHGMAKSPTLQDALARLRYILDNGFEQGKSFYTAPLKVGKDSQGIGSVLGTGGGKPYFDGHFLLTGKPGQMINSADDISTIYINDAYENEEALKAAQKIKAYLQQTYPNKTFKLYSEGFKNGGSIKAANARKWKHKKGGVIKAQEGTKFNWGELIKTVGGIANNAMSTVSENKKLSAQAKQNKQEKVNPLDYITKYLQEIQESNLRSRQAARALGSTVNFNPDIDKHFAYQLANQEVARKNSEIDKQNKLLDVQTENQKTSNWMNLFGNVAQTGLGYLTSNIGKKSTNVNVPPSSTSTTANTVTTSNFDNYMNNIAIQKQLGIV